MKIILNMTRIGQSGGGLQNALSFLRVLPQVASTAAFVVVTEPGAICDESRVHGFEVLIARRLRGVSEVDWRCRELFSRGQMCFTFFGHPWRRSVGYLVNVTGVALSNLFYPEIAFWARLSKGKRCQRFVIDWFRYRSLCLADYWVFETEALAKRARVLAGFPEDRVSVVRMSPSVLVGPEHVDPVKKQMYDARVPSGYRLLFLAGANPNKRIHLAARVVRNLDDAGYLDRMVQVVTTLEESNAYFGSVRSAFRRYGVSDRLHNIGPVPTSDVSSLMVCCNVVCLFSVLESFSNNVVEAWRMRIPLVITDADWARESAGDGALYVDPADAMLTARCIGGLLNDKGAADALRTAGDAVLESYPTGVEKATAYVKCIEMARELGPLAETDRRSMVPWLELCRSEYDGA